MLAAVALSCQSDGDGREPAPGPSGEDGGKAERVEGQPCEEEYDPLLCVQGVLIGDLPDALAGPYAGYLDDVFPP